MFQKCGADDAAGGEDGDFGVTDGLLAGLGVVSPCRNFHACPTFNEPRCSVGPCDPRDKKQLDYESSIA